MSEERVLEMIRRVEKAQELRGPEFCDSEFFRFYFKKHPEIGNYSIEQITKAVVNALRKLASAPPDELNIEVATLSTRCYNALSLTGITSLRELTEFTASDLLKTRTLGRGCLRETIKLLHKHGLHLKGCSVGDPWGSTNWKDMRLKENR